MRALFLLSAAASAMIATASAAPEPNTSRVTFTRAFAPSLGDLAPVEKPLRQELCLNGRWQFQPVPLPANFPRGTGTPPELAAPKATRWESTPLKVPSPWNVNAWGNGRDVGAGTSRPFTPDSIYFSSYPATWDSAQMGWLRRSFRVPTSWGARRIVLRFEAVAGAAQVLVNGKVAGSRFDSFLPFELDITSLIKSGDNELLVGIRKSTLFDKASADFPDQRRTYPNGSNMDSLVGIWDDVFLLGLPAVRVADAFVQPRVEQQVLAAQVTLRNDTDRAQSVRIGGEVRPWINLAKADVLSAPEPRSRLGAPVLRIAPRVITIPARSSASITLQQNVGTRLKFWTPRTPNLYGLTLQVLAGERQIDSHFTRFGWRQWKIKGRDLTLNGKKIQLTGDLLHPFGPFVGSRRHAWAFYKMIQAVGGNAVRPHAQPHPRHYLDLADEMGIAVLDEAAIFGSSISLNLRLPETWRRLEEHVDSMVRRDRNHASVFGWSVGNEMFALLSRASQAERDEQVRRLQVLGRRPRALDPTREWISVDGDEDLGGALPVWSKHAGIGLPSLPDIDKPLMIGEHGGTYYAAPPLLAPLAGERAFESYAGRSEGLAVDTYRIIAQMARTRLAYFSPSELAWFGIEPLPLGLRAVERPPTIEDGVFFGPFVEGRPGIQPERIPPYSMTFNPGFDPALPLFQPLPMFHAMQAALDPRGPQPSRWSAPATTSTRSHPAASNEIERVGFVGDRAGPLFASLFSMGVPLALEGEAASMLIVDGESLSAADAAAARAQGAQVLARGGLVWIMARQSGAALPQLKELLGQDVQVTTRRASSLLRGADDARINGFGLEQLYFAEEGGDPFVQKAGLGGPIAESGRVLLRASNTEWTLFNGRAESEKTAGILIYERLRKPAGAALVEARRGAGKLWVSTLDYRPATPRFHAFWRQLMQNAGVKMGAPPSTALVASSREGAGSEWRFTTEQPAPNWLAPGFDDSAWKLGRGGFGVSVRNGEPRTPWSTRDIWLRHEFSLQDVPRALALQVHHDEDVDVYLNGTLVFEERGHLSDYKEVPLGQEAQRALKIGRNVLAVHCAQTEGGQFLDVGLSRSLDIPTARRPHDLLLDGPLAP